MNLKVKFLLKELKNLRAELDEASSPVEKLMIEGEIYKTQAAIGQAMEDAEIEEISLDEMNSGWYV